MNIHPFFRFLLRAIWATMVLNAIHFWTTNPAPQNTFELIARALMWVQSVGLLFCWRQFDNWLAGLRKVNVVSEEASTHE